MRAVRLDAIPPRLAYAGDAPRDNAAVTSRTTDTRSGTEPAAVPDPRPAALLHRDFRAGRDSLLLAAAVILPRVTGFLTLPIYTRLLGPEDFGRYELLISVMALLYACCLLGLDFAISVRYYGQDDRARQQDVSSALLAAGSASLITTAVLALAAGVLGPILLRTDDGALPF